jgi:hypothetical protein
LNFGLKSGASGRRFFYWTPAALLLGTYRAPPVIAFAHAPPDISVII